MTHPLVITRPLGGSRLGRAALSGDVPRGWYPERPRSVAEWRTRVDELRKEAIAFDWLRRLTPAIGASGAAATRLDRVADGNGVVVTTGQQPGLFGGPIYTWSKALSALALANALEQACGVPVAPVFWAATDDADFEEARSTLVAVPGGVREISLPERSRSGIPMAAVPLGDMAPPIESLSSGAGSAANGSVMQAVRRAYANRSATVGSAYVELLRSILEPLGIAVLDASHEAVRTAMHPVMLQALDRRDAIAVSLERRVTEIRSAGLEPQVELVKDLTLVSLTGAGGKERVHRQRASQVRGSAEPGSLGPTVLLRPVAERAILPTVAYLAGPGELAYFAQTSAVAEALGAASPVAVPRWSCTIVEPHIARILERHRIQVDDLAHENAVEMRLAREAMPDGIGRSLSELRSSIEQGIRALGASALLEGVPLVDPRVTEGARIALNHRVDRLERRVVAALARRASDTATEIATARGALFPRGKPQERALNFIPLVARQGPALMDAMLAEASRHAARLVAPDENVIPEAVETETKAKPGSGQIG